MGRKWLLRILFVLISLGAIYFIALIVVGSIADERLENELAAIRDKGEPLLLAEMAPAPIPDERNAAIPFARAAKLLAYPEGDDWDAVDQVLEDPAGFTPEAGAGAQAWVDQNQPAMEAIEEGLRRPGCRFDYNYTGVEEFLSPSDAGASHLLDFSRLLAVRSILAARNGRAPSAYGDTLRLFELSRHVSADPLLLHALMRIVCEGRALVALHAAFRCEAPDTATRAALLAALDGIDVPGYLHTALLGERCFGRSLFLEFPDHRDLDAMVEGVGDTSGESSALSLRFVPSTIFRLDQARYLNLMGRMIDLSTRPVFETREAWSDLERDLTGKPWYALLSQLVLVSMRTSFERAEIHRAKLDLARIALDLEHAKEVTGQLPDTILIPATEGHRRIIDPFSGRDYRYRKVDEDTYVLWSVGPDQADDQGEDGRVNSYGSGDVAWER